jgi:hypothetical protein
MKEISSGLFIGTQEDYENQVKDKDGWLVVQACKEPYHRQALGYTGRAAPKDHPEYLMAVRGDRLILNLVDADNPAFIRKEVIDEALAFIEKGLNGGKQVLVHCNQGMSRSAGIGLLYLAVKDLIPNRNYEAAEQAYQKIYPPYQPAQGIQGFLKMNWTDYCLS